MPGVEFHLSVLEEKIKLKLKTRGTGDINPMEDDVNIFSLEDKPAEWRQANL